jgi:radical SAM superfamily enzyme YgiQ (UPF0313 family)
MNNVLFISFDLIREGEPEISLSAASLIAYLKLSDTYEKEFTLEHQIIDCNSVNNGSAAFETVFSNKPLPSYNVIALSCHIWSERYVQYFIKKLKSLSWSGLIVLGGPQMNENQQALKLRYPQANVFVQGYGEKAFLHICNNANTFRNSQTTLQIPTASEIIPAVYSNGIIKIENGQQMVRLETKRNCPYRCSFCHFTDFTSNKVGCLNLDTIRTELQYLKEANVEKVNIMDPTFNILHYKEVLKEIIKVEPKSIFSFQTHFSTFDYKSDEVIELFKGANSHLEFGLQSTNPDTLNAINRKHNWEHVSASIRALVHSDISFEISLIYGLPFQSLSNFKTSVQKLRDLGAKNIYGFPLQIYPGTQLTRDMDSYKIVAKPNNLGIEQVSKTNWMSEDDINFLNNWEHTLSK